MTLLPHHHLRRNGDANSLSTVSLLVRQGRELILDVARARRSCTAAQLPGVVAALVSYHLSFAGRPLATSRRREIGAVVNGRKLRLAVRRSTGDLHVYRELFVLGGLGNLSGLGLESARTIVDLGSNVGLATTYLSAWAPVAKFYCAEPAVECNKVARENVRRNGITATVEEVAIAGTDGEVEFFPNGWSASGTIVESISDARSRNTERFESVLAMPSRRVVALTVGSFLDRHGIAAVDLIKFDIEGAEAQVFGGDAYWLRRVRFLLIEVHDKYVSASTVLEALREHGFQQVPSPGAMLLFENGQGVGDDQ